MSQLHLVSWNVNGIRAILKKEFVQSVRAMAPDMICLQETKAPKEEALSALEMLPEYKAYANSSKARKGYSGTAILSKTEPMDVVYDMGIEEHDQEGRVIAAEYPAFFLVTVYTPNSGEGLARLDYRTTWDDAFREYVLWLNRRKPVIMCGDFNVAHQAIDLARPKENYNKSAGYTQKEIDGFDKLLNAGFIDTFRHLYPDTVKYSYWNFVTNGRAKNVGWRIDHFIVPQKLTSHVKDALIYDQYFGSDHCPVGLKIQI
ncbi:MAG: exodeoxyribonuclease III [Cyclobacteriaceae bacterium]|jgi:exodeoxyribonuclease-3|nr:exodeoxyribonuclease III [Cyclobacteriaceae bacterium]